jgi:hypothetical protein
VLAYFAVFADEVTAAWRAKHPGTRPWAFWASRGLEEPPSWEDLTAELLRLGEIDQAELQAHDRLVREWEAYLSTFPRYPCESDECRERLRDRLPAESYWPNRPEELPGPEPRPGPGPEPEAICPAMAPRPAPRSFPSIVARTVIIPAAEFAWKPSTAASARELHTEVATLRRPIPGLPLNREVTEFTGGALNLEIEAYPLPSAEFTYGFSSAQDQSFGIG